MSIIASDGDRLDLLCWQQYGSLDGRVVERVLDANPGIAMTHVLEAGQTVHLPYIEPSPRERFLW